MYRKKNVVSFPPKDDNSENFNLYNLPGNVLKELFIAYYHLKTVL